MQVRDGVVLARPEYAWLPAGGLEDVVQHFMPEIGGILAHQDDPAAHVESVGWSLGSLEWRLHHGPPDPVVVSHQSGTTLHLMIDRPPRFRGLDRLDRCEEECRGVA